MAAELAARVRALEDREAIRELIARYGPLADADAAADAAALWTADGVYAIRGLPEARGHAAIAALLESETHRALLAAGCAHLLGPVAIDLAGDRAHARGHSVVLRWTGTAFAVERVSANRWALARTPSGWRIARRDNALLDGGEAARALLGFGG